MLLRLCLIVGLAIWSGPARSQSAITGPGANSCSQFLSLFEQDPHSYGLLFYAWAQGFMSGMNTVALKVKGQVIDLQPEGYRPERQMVFLKSFCEQYPLRTYSEAVFSLMTELKLPATP